MVSAIYKILTHKRFRVGPLPSLDVQSLVLKQIRSGVTRNLPVELLQFWGGCKNVNVSSDRAELCEEATLDNLHWLHRAVQQVYPKGLKISISPGDARVEKVNHVPHSKTEIYVQSLRRIAEQERYGDLFKIIPISSLYQQYATIFDEALVKTKLRIENEIERQPGFEVLVKNARKNIFVHQLKNQDEIYKTSVTAARDYVIYRVAEEEAGLFQQFQDCIRCFFIRYTPFYKQFISDLENTTPRLDCFLTLYTGGKGNVTQPWQAVGVREKDAIVFLSQERAQRKL